VRIDGRRHGLLEGPRADAGSRGTRTARMSGLWSHPQIGRPENELTGVTFARAGYARAGGASPAGIGRLHRASPHHWRSTARSSDTATCSAPDRRRRLRDRRLCARARERLPLPTHEDGTPRTFVVLATSPARLWSNTQATSDVPCSCGPASTWPTPTATCRPSSR
jgi:hypothetical protein